jgi:shikimate dehydrogenase
VIAIDAETRIAGVVGRPVRHSLSPVIHNAWIEAAGINAVYLAFAPPAAGFARLVEGLRGGVALGLNVTIPFKQDALAVAERATERARRAGAANLLSFNDDGGVVADNTDGAGLVLALRDAGWRPEAGPVVLLGAGGAARGAILALLDAGAPEVAVVNRTPERAQALCGVDPRVSAHGMDAVVPALTEASALVNATSLGMTGQPPLEFGLDGLPDGAVVMDMVYRPLQTGLLRRAQARGLRTADGLSMLIGQAAPSFETLFGLPPPQETDVRALCAAALGAA